MNSPTIDFGIDLGTTNSSIARLNATRTDVFRNVATGLEYTPSAVWIDDKRSVKVGREARQWYERDPQNVCIEFKRNMGKATEYQFAHSGMRLKPEELSAEVLKSLRADVQAQRNEPLRAAVIAVPADFELDACAATQRAATLAGFEHTLFLQEPVAAAQAYGFEREEQKTVWLVYDFGGGTFDAAIIQVRDGLTHVIGHGGDNELGGQEIDWEIVETLFVPALKDYALSDFRRGNERWRGAFAKLKLRAEEAKMALSSATTTLASQEFLCKDDRGEPVEFNYELTRAAVERLAEPLIRRSIRICRETLQNSNLAPSAVSRILLVGGPTLMPGLRTRLGEELGIPLEWSVDPLTVVARGAAVFAGAQRLPDPEWRNRASSGRFAVKLGYLPVGPETEPQVGGMISAGEHTSQDFTGYTVQIFNDTIRPPWRSGRIALDAAGSFTTTVRAAKGECNQFRLELCNSTGDRQAVQPDTFTITVKGIGPAQMILPHAVGIALANNELALFFERGISLPAKRTRANLRTAIFMKRGESGVLLRVPVVEGNRERADRNRLIGMLTIPAENISRDLPLQSEVEVTIEIDASRSVHTKAYIPILDEEFQDVLPLVSQTPNVAALRERHQQVRDRLTGLRDKLERTNQIQALAAISRIDDESLVQRAGRLLSAASGDPAAAVQCEHLLMDIDAALDDAEDAQEMPELIVEAQELLDSARKLIKQSDYVTKEDRADFVILERETLETLAQQAPTLLLRRMAALRSFLRDIVLRDPGPWIRHFEDLKAMQGQMLDPAIAERLIRQGERAIIHNNLGGLQIAVRELCRIMPSRPKSDSQRYPSDIIQ